jgi:hypothetical protein
MKRNVYQFFSRFIEDDWKDSEEWEAGRARLGRSASGQRSDHVTSGFRLKFCATINFDHFLKNKKFLILSKLLHNN